MAVQNEDDFNRAVLTKEMIAEANRGSIVASGSGACAGPAGGAGGGTATETTVTAESQAACDAKLAAMRELQIRAEVARRQQVFNDQMIKLLGEQKSPFCPPPGTVYGSLGKEAFGWAGSVTAAKDAPIDHVKEAVTGIAVKVQRLLGLTAKSALPPGKDHAASLAAAAAKAKQKNFGFGQSHITFDRLVQIAVEEYLKQRGLGW